MADLLRWKYYNHAVVPSIAPHETVDASLVQNGKVWKQWPKAILARWTTEFDCGYETNWWYIIKDKPFDIGELKAKRRYEINKGQRNFEVSRIDPNKYKNELFDVQGAAFSAWPEKYRPQNDKVSFMKSVDKWEKYYIYGAFHRGDHRLCGYALLIPYDNYIDFAVLRTVPEYESYAVNAALVYGILNDQTCFLSSGGYICDGSRSITHETAFQDYLEKYFGFRKAYCRLNVQFKPGVSSIIACLYPFKKHLQKLDSIGLVHKVNGLLKMKAFAEEQVPINE